MLTFYVFSDFSMQLELIKNLLDKYKNMVPAERRVVEATQVILKNELGIDVEIEQINYVQRTIHLDVPALVRTKIMQKKETILEKLEEKLGKATPKDIR